MKSLADITRELVSSALKNDGAFEAPLVAVAGALRGRSSLGEFEPGELESAIAEIKAKLTASYLLNTSRRMQSLQEANKRTRLKYFFDDERGQEWIRILLVDGAAAPRRKASGLTYKDGVQAMAGFNPDVLGDSIKCMETAQAIVKQYREHAATILGGGNED